VILYNPPNLNGGLGYISEVWKSLHSLCSGKCWYIGLLDAYKCSGEAFFNHMTFMLVHMNTHLLVIRLSASDVFGQLMLWGLRR